MKMCLCIPNFHWNTHPRVVNIRKFMRVFKSTPDAAPRSRKAAVGDQGEVDVLPNIMIKSLCCLGYSK